ncbi:hypothetical protein F4780DRAFT_774909 [Xylariomycetidae sp. FL0641]|nr:hypothetical protein F4780DRAFT_774909 [Xylariomycetidae sp. FL0641]
MTIRGKPRERSPPTRKVSPPSGSYMNNEQFAAYLASLRDSRVNRPGGARPLPTSTKFPRPESADRTTVGRPASGDASVRSEFSSLHRRTDSEPIKTDPMKTRESRRSLVGSVVSRQSMNTTTGRDYYPGKDQKASPPLKPSEVVPSARYIERGQRWMEKEEAFSLRQAMDAMDIKDGEKQEGKDDDKDDDETRLYNAALDEASELVYQHQHGIKPREPGTPFAYKPHLRKDSYAHARAASAGRYGEDVGATGLARDPPRSNSGSSTGSGSDRTPSPESRRGSRGSRGSQGSMENQHSPKNRTRKFSPPAAHSGVDGSRSGGRRRSSMKRDISGEIQKPFPGDQIWEESEGSAASAEQSSRQPRTAGIPQSQPLGLKTRNGASKVQFASESAAPSVQAPTNPLSRTEIYKNPPSQSRNPKYTTNSPFDAARRRRDIPTKNGMEVRGDDIRQATSARLKDRSAKLPTPSAVSDSPGRPIVSFDRTWKSPEEAADSKAEEPRRVPKAGVAKERSIQDPQPTVPTISFTPDAQVPSPTTSRPRPSAVPDIQVNSGGGRPPVPTIALPDDTPPIPSISLPDDDDNINGGGRAAPNVPVIVTPDDTTSKPSSSRPLPNPQAMPPHLRNARGGRPQSHWSPAPGASRRATAICHECNLPIEGRFVALHGASERFHPQCFRCYACGTGLEALEISPEPDAARAARLGRIAARAAGEALPETPGETMAEDGDARLRFYCHLDWHELFAPRCRHCKTPILGDHVVALGAHWHEGHFFCAECGDPFPPGATHVEKDGYAYCVGCQTKRTERRAPKCRRCRIAVVGETCIRALGAEWHDHCFRCAECDGSFDDGQVFPVERRGQMTVLCTGCRSRELKM